MTARTKTLSAAVALIVLLVVSLYAAIFATSGLPGTSKTYVEARFSDVGGLREGDDVREASVRIGRVDSIQVEGDHALVRLQLSGEREVYADARAAVWARSGLGQNFVELNLGHRSAGPLGDDAIRRARTVAPSQLDELLDVLDRPTRGALASTLREVGGGVEGRSEQLASFLQHAPATLDGLRHTSNALASDDADLAGLLDATRALSSSFRGHDEEVAALVSELDDTLAAIDTDGGEPLRQTLANAPAALDAAETALESLQQPLADLNSAARALHPGTEALGTSTPNLREFLRDAQVPLGMVPDVAEVAEPALDTLSDAMDDARPLVERLEYTFAATEGPAAYMAPYAPEISQFFDYWHSANGSGDVSGHWLRLGFLVRPESIDGALPAEDAFTYRNPYPAPGQAQQDRAPEIGGY